MAVSHGNRHNQAYDDIIMGYIWKELLLQRFCYPRPRPIISVSKIWRAIKERGYPKVHRTTVIRHLEKLVEQHELVEVPKENDKGRRYNATSFGLVLYSVRVGKEIWSLSVHPDPNPNFNPYYPFSS